MKRPNGGSPRVREILDKIQEFLLTEAIDAHDLWAILTALRGPDEYDDHLGKMTGTIPVRAAAFPKLAKQAAENERHSGYNSVNGAMFETSETFMEDRIQTYRLVKRSEHLGDHVKQAFDALGMEYFTEAKDENTI